MSTATVILPEYEVAAAAMIRLAKQAAEVGFSDHIERYSYRGAWGALRRVAEQVTNRRGLVLTTHEKDLLEAALYFAAPGPDRDYVNSLTFDTRS